MALLSPVHFDLPGPMPFCKPVVLAVLILRESDPRIWEQRHCAREDARAEVLPAMKLLFPNSDGIFSGWREPLSRIASRRYFASLQYELHWMLVQSFKILRYATQLFCIPHHGDGAFV